MSEGGRSGREMPNCVEWSTGEYDAQGGYTATTIRIETCGSDAGSSRRSSRKTTSTVRRRKKKKLMQQHQQMWFATAEEDFFPPTTTRQASSSAGKARCAVKTPFATSSAGAPYNKKLRKKNMQRQPNHLSFGATMATATPTTTATATTTVEAERSSPSFFISAMHRAVAEATTPWDTTAGPGSTRYQFFGHGGLSANVPRAVLGGKRGTNNEADDDCPLSTNSRKHERSAVGGGSYVLAPLRSPSVLPPLQLLPASKAEVNSDVLERCFLEAQLGDDDNFSLL
ncbi:hypothetical protein DQ04_06801000 [Trypanosoma grayi]|uniref:hypothetical protein n=1 Tax=Trypanosoma grayi TaxID=71804 RepID=UPI0004F452D6|nr:hypothetical protein DQ04_06801000 [Trypanosoma grayi]KEG08614.1 hypothetical protein DQ04_06801000 [Trypanosoma grayi]